MTTITSRFTNGILTVILAAATAISCADGADVPRDNPVASYYGGDIGYPTWTDRIRWRNVIDMSEYDCGETDFERFESARDELAAAGGGVLYYPSGTYDFSNGPFDGPNGRGLMLRSGVVIRGEAPAGRPLATEGPLDLPTEFVFGFKPRANGIDVGQRFSLELDGGDMRVHRNRPKRQGPKNPGVRTTESYRYEPAPLILSFPVDNGKIGQSVKGFRRGYGRDVWPGSAKVTQSGNSIHLSVDLTIDDTKYPGSASYEITLKRQGDDVVGQFQGRCRDQRITEKVTGRFHVIHPETPRDWNLVGQRPEPRSRLRDIDNVGICWVHLVGATIYFGPDLNWGSDWATAESWKSDYVKPVWGERRPDGTHPWDPLAGGGRQFVGVGDGRLVFGCEFERAAVLNESVTMGRPDLPNGFGPDGYYSYKFGPRIGAYGSRVFVANNRLPMCRGSNFKYQQTTRRTFPSGGGAGMGFDPPRQSVILFDYNKSCGIDVNKCLLGRTKETLADQQGNAGFFAPFVTIVDNFVYNNGHKGFNISGDWVTIARNHNERQMLREGYDPERIGGWELTLDGHLESSPGGNGAISDNLSRAFDIGGRNVWVHRNTYNNTGSAPGNDGEGILCQSHGGTQVYSWAITYNHHEQGDGQSGYIGGWDVNIAGALFGWNQTAGWIGAVNVGKREAVDVAFVANHAAGGEKVMPSAQVGDAEDRPAQPEEIKAERHGEDAVLVRWKDADSNEAGFRIDRKIAEGDWIPIAYRPPRIAGHPDNRQVWIDSLAPTSTPLVYRVVALDSRDDDHGASEPTDPIVLPKP